MYNSHQLFSNWASSARMRLTRLQLQSYRSFEKIDSVDDELAKTRLQVKTLEARLTRQRYLKQLESQLVEKLGDSLSGDFIHTIQELTQNESEVVPFLVAIILRQLNCRKQLYVLGDMPKAFLETFQVLKEKQCKLGETVTDIDTNSMRLLEITTAARKTLLTKEYENAQQGKTKDKRTNLSHDVQAEPTCKVGPTSYRVPRVISAEQKRLRMIAGPRREKMKGKREFTRIPDLHAAIDNVILASTSNEKTVSMLKRGSDQWKPFINFGECVRALVSWQTNCYVAAGYGSNTNIYKCDLRSENCQPILDIPDIFRKEGLFSICASSDDTENELIFLIGQSFDNQSGQQFALRYDTREGTWGTLPNFQVDSQWLCLSSAFGINTLYAAESHVVVDRQFAAQMYSLDLAELTAWKASSVVMEHLYSTIACVGGYMISIGGMSTANHQHVANSYVFDSLIEKWYPLPSMTTARVAPGVCVSGDRSITVMGAEMDVISGEIVKTYI